MSCWLMKAEPETRIVKGQDVKFSAEDFEKAGVTSWEGVRSHQAKKILKEKIKIGDRVLFYASNTKVPRITSLAHCVKEGYPDYNAWDPAHPYYDEKSIEANPTWFMVDVQFDSNLKHDISLKFLQHLSSLDVPPSEIPYLTQEALDGIKIMTLLNKGRLSVQPVENIVYEAIVEMAEKGGFEEMILIKKPPVKRVKKETTVKAEEEDELESEDEEKPKKKAKIVQSKKVVVKKVQKVKKEEGEEEESDLTEISSDEEVIKKGKTSRSRTR